MPKIIHNNPTVGFTQHYNSAGFTLIELLVVTVIIFTLSGLGIAGYNRFNQVQVLKQSAEDLKSVLRDAQNRAAVGQKDESICGSAPTSLPLDHWRFFITDNNAYTISGFCNSEEFSISTYDTPTNITLSPISGTIDFKPLGQGITDGLTGTITFTNSALDSSIDITVSISGDITVSAMY